MSTAVVGAVGPDRGADEPNTTTVGGTKPLHRFLRAHPKCVGVMMTALGGSLFIMGIPLKMDDTNSSADAFSSFWLGLLFITCGILYIQAELKISKKIVTASLALSIISILGAVTAFFEFLKSIIYTTYSISSMYFSGLNQTDAVYFSQLQNQIFALEVLFMVQSIAGAVVLITMAVFARAALRSSRTQAVVVMKKLPTAE
ncbi:uncharacterized protein LOC114795198 [Denticeps clupeoides]|uniref:Uncharacterized protein n=1 Tax=Denticeps clupeoides TaxID=299321 RepID=A0AAY4C3G7_9TELE|nr:uncharacterized protein LOC114795198 [Denticeps clupeoides]